MLCACGCGQDAPLAPHTDASRGYVKGQPLRYVRGHNSRRDAAERYWEKVDRRGPDECWPWLASLTPSTGYGAFSANRRTVTAHAFGFALAGGVVPRGMTIDHECRHRWCQNPAHMRVVTRGENVLLGVGPSAANARKTHCLRGHELAGRNLYVVAATGARRCLACVALKEAERRTRRNLIENGGNHVAVS